jgi:glycosyltransferase involved in cell wall biosynthesis
VPVKDARALADAIDQLERDPELRNRLGNASRAKALAEFEESIVIDRTMSVYRELTAPAGPELVRS